MTGLDIVVLSLVPVRDTRGINNPLSEALISNIALPSGAEPSVFMATCAMPEFINNKNATISVRIYFIVPKISVQNYLLLVNIQIFFDIYATFRNLII